MPRIDFYVLEGAEDRARLVYACRVIEKAFLQGLTVCVNLGTAAESESFDTLLWTFADRSFVPHALATGGEAVAAMPPATPVWVGCQQAVAADVLVNLSPEVPAFYANYARVAEVIDAEPGRREAGRRRFARYREHGHTPDTHKVGS
jgi:DNA polymerase III subunit chi